LRGTAIAEHALIPCFAGKFVGFLPGIGGALADARIELP
jgi:TctA family transporter